MKRYEKYHRGHPGKAIAFLREKQKLSLRTNAAMSFRGAKNIIPDESRRVYFRDLSRPYVVLTSEIQFHLPRSWYASWTLNANEAGQIRLLQAAIELLHASCDRQHWISYHRWSYYKDARFEPWNNYQRIFVALSCVPFSRVYSLHKIVTRFDAQSRNYCTGKQMPTVIGRAQISFRKSVSIVEQRIRG